MCKITHKICNVCKRTHCVQNYTGVLFAFNMKKCSRLKFFHPRCGWRGWQISGMKIWGIRTVFIVHPLSGEERDEFWCDVTRQSVEMNPGTIICWSMSNCRVLSTSSSLTISRFQVAKFYQLSPIFTISSTTIRQLFHQNMIKVHLTPQEEILVKKKPETGSAWHLQNAFQLSPSESSWSNFSEYI